MAGAGAIVLCADRGWPREGNQMITVLEHDKREWARFAQACYGRGFNEYGHRYSAAASLPRGAQMDVARFDQLQAGYRVWLVFNEMGE